MTISKELKFEKTLGCRVTQQEIRDEETRKLMEIKSYANNHGYTDVNPFEVIRTISPTCVEVRAMRTVQTKFPKDFHAGGFAGNFSDNYDGQDYDYFSDPEAPVFKIRWSRAKRQWQSSYGRVFMSDKPYKHYDYNF